MGNMILAANHAVLAASHSKSSAGNYTFLLIIVLFGGFIYFVMFRPQRRRRQNAMQMQSGLVPGQRIRTTAGMYGTVSSVEDNDVVVEVAPGVNIRMLRRAVMEVVPDGAMGNGMAPSPGPSAGQTPDDEVSAEDLDSRDHSS